MIYDTFMFCHELDLLEARLNILSDVVDKFVIVEAPVSHTRLPKPLYFLDNISRFEKWLPRIIYRSAKVDHHENPWFNEFSYREILLSMVNRKDDDIIIHGDLDEIPNPETLKEVIKNLREPVVFVNNYYMFCVDLFGRNDSPDTIVMKGGWIREPMAEYRKHRSNFQKKVFNQIKGCGWHYSYCVSLPDIVTKLKFFAHAPEVPEHVKSETHIKECIRNRRVFDLSLPEPNIKYIQATKENTHPYFLDNKDKFPYLFASYYD